MHLSQWLEQCEELWSAHGEGTRSFADHLNYFDQLLSQFPLRKLRVVYAKSGTKPAAAIIEDDTAVFDHVLYWTECRTRQEALFLCAILNSETARKRAEKWQAEGQWSKRHFDKVMFNLPIPTFDSRIALHREIATVAAKAEAAAAVATINEGDYFVTVRNRIRKHLTDVGLAPAIDKLVEKLLDGG